MIRVLFRSLRLHQFKFARQARTLLKSPKVSAVYSQENAKKKERPNLRLSLDKVISDFSLKGTQAAPPYLAMNGSKRVPATQLINGEACSAYYSPTSYMEALEFEPREGDIIEVTFTRSGTHLVQQMIQLILNKGQSTKTFAEFNKRAPFLEVQGLREASGAPRLLRTHLPMNRLRLSDKAKYVYVARNPWDCCVSNFHLMQDFPLFEFADGTFDDFLDTFLDGRFGFGDYFDHIISGDQYPQRTPHRLPQIVVPEIELCRIFQVLNGRASTDIKDGERDIEMEPMMMMMNDAELAALPFVSGG
ncbi:putative salivary sulfotransferase [Ixodes scapularis]